MLWQQDDAPVLILEQENTLSWVRLFLVLLLWIMSVYMDFPSIIGRGVCFCAFLPPFPPFNFGFDFFNFFNWDVCLNLCGSILTHSWRVRFPHTAKMYRSVLLLTYVEKAL